MRVIAFILGLFSVSGAVLAQQAAPAPGAHPELPAGPLLKRAPEFSEWVATYNPMAAAKEDKSKPAQAPRPPDEQTTVTKTKGTYHIQVASGSKTKSDKWCVDDLQVTTVPNAARPILSTPGEGDADYYLDLSKTDFPGFTWVSPKNFVEVKNVSGTDCIFFKDRIKNSAGDEVEAQAVIDLKTRLPISLQVGDAVTTYQHRPAPSALLSPPSDIARLIAQWRQRHRQAGLLPPP